MTQTGDSCCMVVGALSTHFHTVHACQRKNMTRQTFCAAGSVPATPPVLKTDGYFFLEELARFQVCSCRRGATRMNHLLWAGLSLTNHSRGRLWPRVVCPRLWRTMPAEFCAYAGARLSGVKPEAQRLKHNDFELSTLLTQFQVAPPLAQELEEEVLLEQEYLARTIAGPAANGDQISQPDPVSARFGAPPSQAEALQCYSCSRLPQWVTRIMSAGQLGELAGLVGWPGWAGGKGQAELPQSYSP